MADSYFYKFFHVILEPQTYFNILYLVISFPLGAAYFSFLLLGLSLGLSLFITLLGIPILIGMLFAWWSLLVFERKIIIILLSKRLPKIQTRMHAKKYTFWQNISLHLTDSLTWRGLIYLFLRFPLGIFSFLLVFSLLSITLSLLIGPLTVLLVPTLTSIYSFTFIQASFLAIGGIIFLTISLHVTNALTNLYFCFTKALLSPDEPLKKNIQRTLLKKEKIIVKTTSIKKKLKKSP